MLVKRKIAKKCALTSLLVFVSAPVGIAEAASVRAGFDANSLASNDDGSTGLVPLGFTVDFFGVSRSSAYVNNNGNITFDSTLSTFTPFNLTSTGQEIIAPFFADVHTDPDASAGTVEYGSGTVNGRDAWGATWTDVSHYFSPTTRRNTFQVVLIERFDTGAGNFDIEFNYDQIEWETGDASGGTNGLGGSSARVGYSNGTGSPGTAFELAGSAVNGAFLDSNLSTGLIHNSLNSNVDGRYVFSAREGTIITNPNPIPSPTAALVGVIGIGGMCMRRRRSNA